MRVWDVFPAFYLYSVGVITLSGTESYFLNVATRFVLLFFNKIYQLRLRFLVIIIFTNKLLMIKILLVLQQMLS